MTRPDWDSTWMQVALDISQRTLCTGDQVGAVIASSTNRVVAVGYNNPPAKFDHQGKNCSTWCPRRLLTTEVTGYQSRNDFSSPPMPELTFTSEGTFIPELVIDNRGHEYEGLKRVDETPEQFHEFMTYHGYEPVYVKPKADYSDCYSLHAEANALSVCDRDQREGGTMYVTSAPCFSCAKLISNSGLHRLVFKDSERGRERTSAEPYSSFMLMKMSGIEVIVDECIDCVDADCFEVGCETRRHEYTGACSRPE